MLTLKCLRISAGRQCGKSPFYRIRRAFAAVVLDTLRESAEGPRPLHELLFFCWRGLCVGGGRGVAMLCCPCSSGSLTQTEGTFIVLSAESGLMKDLIASGEPSMATVVGLSSVASLTVIE